METLKGTVTKIKVLQMSNRPLIRFSVDGQSAIMAKHSLNFLADVDEGMTIAVAGYYNPRKQFVVQKYSVIGKTKLMLEFELLKARM
ncbi:hypothetical protein [Enterococcus sp. LJL90]